MYIAMYVYTIMFLSSPLFTVVALKHSLKFDPTVSSNVVSMDLSFLLCSSGIYSVLMYVHMCICMYLATLYVRTQLYICTYM